MYYLIDLCGSAILFNGNSSKVTEILYRTRILYITIDCNEWFCNSTSSWHKNIYEIKTVFWKKNVTSHVHVFLLYKWCHRRGNSRTSSLHQVRHKLYRAITNYTPTPDFGANETNLKALKQFSDSCFTHFTIIKVLPTHYIFKYCH